MRGLDNAAGTGWLPTLVAEENDTMSKAAALLARNPSADELAAFQKAAAERALAVLKAIRPASTSSLDPGRARPDGGRR